MVSTAFSTRRDTRDGGSKKDAKEERSEKRRGFLRIAAALAREGLAASLHQVPNYFERALRGSNFFWLKGSKVGILWFALARIGAGGQRVENAAQKYFGGGVTDC